MIEIDPSRTDLVEEFRNNPDDVCSVSSAAAFLGSCALCDAGLAEVR
jgi:hypothetical protein